MTEPSSADRAHAAALDLLARRTHFESELVRKLARKGFAAADVSAALGRLRSAGLVDDRKAAVELIGAKLRRGPRGARRLRADLARKGLDAEVIDAALAEALPGDESALAAEAARRFSRRRGGANRRALARHLDRMGFGARDILALSEEPADPEPPEDAG